MRRISLSIFSVFFVLTSLISVSEKVKLPNYEKWNLFKYGPKESDFSTLRDGCKSIKHVDTLKEAEVLDEEALEKMHVDLAYDQYRSGEPDYDFLDVIKDANGKPWLIFWVQDDNLYLFKRQRRFVLFGYKWVVQDTYEFIENEEREAEINRIISFQVRNCLFFPTQ